LTLTFTYDGKPGDEPHTITVVSVKDLPKTSAQINNCTICNETAAGHLKNPKAPPGPTNDIAHWIVDKGKPGLDEAGDSIAIEGAKHKSISIKVTAPAGTVLHFICAVHPWMQGTIKVINTDASGAASPGGSARPLRFCVPRSWDHGSAETTTTKGSEWRN
jgi:hypothetical protein